MAGRILPLLLLTTFVFADERIVPVYEEPRHRLMQEGENHRVLDLEIVPGDTSLFHVHDQPIFYVYLRSAALRVQPLGGEWSTIPAPSLTAGDVRYDDSYVTSPVTHRVGNVGDQPFRLILVLNEREAPFQPGENVTMKLPGESAVDSEYFAQSRVDLAPGANLDWEELDRLVVYVLITGTHVVVRQHGEDPTAAGLHQPGQFVSVSSGRALSIENRSDRQATIIAVGVR